MQRFCVCSVPDALDVWMQRKENWTLILWKVRTLVPVTEPLKVLKCFLVKPAKRDDSQLLPEQL